MYVQPKDKVLDSLLEVNHPIAPIARADAGSARGALTAPQAATAPRGRTPGPQPMILARRLSKNVHSLTSIV